MKKSIFLQVPFFPVDSIVEVNRVDYQVIKGSGCLECCFYMKNFQECAKDITRFGNCSASLRYDEEDVIFIELKDQ